jgi:hypothetical protein
MAYSVFRVPNGITVLPTGVAQVVTTVQGTSGQTADLQQWQSSAGTVLARVDSAGNISGVAMSGTTANFSSDLTVLGNTILGDNSADTITVSGTPTFIQASTFNSNLTVLGNTTLGDNSADTITVSGTPTFIQNSTFQNALTVNGALNAYGNITLGNAAGDTITVSGTPTFAQNATFAGDIFVNGGEILTTAATFALAPANATAINIGSTSSTTNVNILSTSGTINANGGTIRSTATTMNLFNSTTTSNVVNISTGANISGVVNVLTNATNGTINLGNPTTNTVIQGDLIVNGTTTTVNSTTINIDDLNLNLASDSGTLSTVDGGGITVGSGLGITMNYDHANTSWTSSQNFNIATTKTYKIAGTDVLNATGIGAGVILSSLQRVGTIATGVWNASVIGTGYTTAQVTAVTAGATNTISVTGTTQAPFINLATVGTPVTTSFVKITTDAYGRVTATTAVVSGDIPNHSAAQITAGTLAVAQGGTNLASYGTGVLLQASGTTISQISPTTSGHFLRTNGANTFSTYGALTSTDVTTALGFTPANSTNGISGAGVSGRLTIWDGVGSVTSDADLIYSSSNNILSLSHGNIAASNTVLTIGTTGTDVIDSFSKDSYRTVKYLIQVANTISGPTEFQVSEVLVVHDGTTAYLTEYGKMYTGANPLLTSITVAIISGTTVSLRATAAVAGAIVRFTKITMNN